MNIKAWSIGLFTAVTSIVIIYAGVIIYLTWPITKFTVNSSGVFGDSFGLLTSLFSGLAFSGLIITILLQREDLKLQKDELSETRKEMKFQNFETTFFQMLRLHNEIVDAISIREPIADNRVIESGRACFKHFTAQFKDYYNDKKTDNSLLAEQELIIVAYTDFWESNQQDLDHYFRYLYRIFKYVNDSFVDNEQKKLYTSIARAQLSDLEMVLLLYNCLSIYGSDKFKPLAERYCLFDNLPQNLLITSEHISLFEPSAFQKN